MNNFIRDFSNGTPTAQTDDPDPEVVVRPPTPIPSPVLGFGEVASAESKEAETNAMPNTNTEEPRDPGSKKNNKMTAPEEIVLSGSIH